MTELSFEPAIFKGLVKFSMTDKENSEEIRMTLSKNHRQKKYNF